MINVKDMEIRFLITHKALMEGLIHVSNFCTVKILHLKQITVSTGQFGAHVSEVVLGMGEVLGGVRPNISEETNCQG